MAAILGRPPFGKGGRAVLRPTIWIEQHARLRVEAVANVEHGLVLEAVIAGVEVMMALYLGDSEPLIIVHLGHPRAEGGACRKGREEGLRHLILGGHPGADLIVASNVILEPPIGIGDSLAELLLDDGAARGV